MIKVLVNGVCEKQYPNTPKGQLECERYLISLRDFRVNSLPSGKKLMAAKRGVAKYANKVGSYEKGKLWKYEYKLLKYTPNEQQRADKLSIKIVKL